MNAFNIICNMYVDRLKRYMPHCHIAPLTIIGDGGCDSDQRHVIVDFCDNQNKLDRFMSYNTDQTAAIYIKRDRFPVRMVILNTARSTSTIITRCYLASGVKLCDAHLEVPSSCTGKWRRSTSQVWHTIKDRQDIDSIFKDGARVFNLTKVSNLVLIEHKRGRFRYEYWLDNFIPDIDDSITDNAKITAKLFGTVERVKSFGKKEILVYGDRIMKEYSWIYRHINNESILG